MQSLTIENTVATIKQLGVSCLGWYKQLPLYQKIITCIGVATGSLISRSIYCRLHRKIFNYPPGPIGLPYVGYTPWFDPMSMQFYKDMYPQNEKGEETKDIQMVYIFGQPFVLISDIKLFQEIAKRVNYRAAGQLMELKHYPVPFASESNTKVWNKRRQLNHAAFTSLINSNYIDTIMKSLIESNIFPAMDQQCKSTKPYHCREDIKWLGFAFLFGVLYGVDGNIPQKHDAEFRRFMKKDLEAMNSMWLGVFIALMPTEMVRSLVRRVTDPWQAFDDMVEIIVKWDKNKVKGTQSEETYFNRMDKFIANGQMTKQEAYADVLVLVGAGLHVTLGCIEWTLYYAAKFQDVQERVYQELKAHYDKYKGFEMKKMSELHVFRAFVYESLRTNHGVPTTAARHVETNDFKVGEYNVPKGASLFGMQFVMLRDKKLWEKPNEFYIEHFLDENDCYKKNDNFMMFGYGKRNCVGQSLAIRELYAILSALLYRYKFSIPNEEENDWKIPFFMFWDDNTPTLPLHIEQRNT